AKLATPITSVDLSASLRAMDEDLSALIATQLLSLNNQLTLAQSELRRNSPHQRVQNALQRQDELRERLDRAVQSQLKARAFRLENAASRLTSLNPADVLRRGYAIITDKVTGQVISRTTQVTAGQSVHLRVQDGSIPAQITPPIPGEFDHA
ncbi:MAG: exodeoxyribonuclease VII large subunit, partial [Anaerolineaceae bacterium]